MEFLLIAAAVWVLSKGWTHVKADFGRSRDAHAAQTAKQYPGGTPAHVAASNARRHLLGYMGREAARGFPVWRTGLHMGMLAHRTALAHARMQREEARDTHEELQETLRQRVAERRARRYAEQEEVFDTDDVLAGSPREQARAADDLADRRRRKEEAQAGEPAGTSPPPGSPAPGPFAPPAQPAPDWFDGAEPDRTDPDDEDATSDPPAPGEWRAGDSWGLNPDEPRCEECGGAGCDACRGWGNGPWDPDAPEAEPGAVCAADGRPATPDDPVTVQPGGAHVHKSCAADSQADYEARRMSPDAAANPTDPTSPATEGAPVPATDTTFASVLANAIADVAKADQDTQSIRAAAAAAYERADAMTAADVDSAVIDAQLARAAKLSAAAGLVAEAGEYAGSVKTLAEQKHGGMQEAHDNAPGKIATREFHGGS